jgi:hypothetical protein
MHLDFVFLTVGVVITFVQEISDLMESVFLVEPSVPVLEGVHTSHGTYQNLLVVVLVEMVLRVEHKVYLEYHPY